MTTRRHHVRRRSLPRPLKGERVGVRGCPHSVRSGATLTEVLMSLLIMGLGITSVFTLFPMSILRSVKSTNLTHAALLAETGREVFIYRNAELTNPPARSGFGKDFLLSYPPNNTLAVNDATIPANFTGTFVVDPVGGVNAEPFGRTPGRFGQVLRVSTLPGEPPTATTLADVQDLASSVYTSHDSWITILEDVPQLVQNITTPSVATEISFTADVDLNASILTRSSINPGTRVLVLSQDGRQSFTVDVDPNNPVPAANRLRLSRQLPTSLYSPPGTDRIGLVRVQNFERRYTYLMTMHRDELGSTTGELVVFFRRQFGDAETTYTIRATDPPDPILGIDTLNRKLTVQFGGATNVGAPSPGNYIFGTWLSKPGNPVVNGRWYRIVGVEELDSAQWESPATGPEYRLTLDRNWEGLTHPDNQPRAMLSNSVISVFDL